MSESHNPHLEELESEKDPQNEKIVNQFNDVLEGDHSKLEATIARSFISTERTIAHGQGSALDNAVLAKTYHEAAMETFGTDSDESPEGAVGRIERVRGMIDSFKSTIPQVWRNSAFTFYRKQADSAATTIDSQALAVEIHNELGVIEQYSQKFKHLAHSYFLVYGRNLDELTVPVIHMLEAGFIVKGALPLIFETTKEKAGKFWDRMTGRNGEKVLDPMIETSAYSEFTVERRMGGAWHDVLAKIDDEPLSKSVSKRSIQMALMAESARQTWNKRRELGVHETKDHEPFSIIYMHKLSTGSEVPLVIDADPKAQIDPDSPFDIISLARQFDSMIKRQEEMSNRSLDRESLSALQQLAYNNTQIDKKHPLFNDLSKKKCILLTTDNDGDLSDEKRHDNLIASGSDFLNYGNNVLHFRMSFGSDDELKVVSQRSNHRNLDGKEAKNVLRHTVTNMFDTSVSLINGEINENRYKPRIRYMLQENHGFNEDLKQLEFENKHGEINAEVNLNNEDSLALNKRVQEVITHIEQETGEKMPLSVAKLLPYVNLLIFPQDKVPTCQFVIINKQTNALDVATAMLPANSKEGHSARFIYQMFLDYAKAEGKAEFWENIKPQDAVFLREYLKSTIKHTMGKDVTPGFTDASFFSALSSGKWTQKLNQTIGDALNRGKHGSLLASAGGGIASCPSNFGKDPMSEHNMDQEDAHSRGIFERLKEIGIENSSSEDLSEEISFTTAGTAATMNTEEQTDFRAPSVSMEVKNASKPELVFHFRSNKFNQAKIRERAQKNLPKDSPGRVSIEKALQGRVPNISQLSEEEFLDVYEKESLKSRTTMLPYAYNFLLDLLDYGNGVQKAA